MIYSFELDDVMDLRAVKIAKAAYEDDHVEYTLDEVEQML